MGKHQDTTVWYCPICGDGPLNYDIVVGCPQCGYIRDSSATVETVRGISSGGSVPLPQPVPPPPMISQPPSSATITTYPVAQLPGSRTISTSSKEPEFVSLADLDAGLDSTVSPKDVLSGSWNLLSPENSAEEPLSAPKGRDASHSEPESRSSPSSLKIKTNDGLTDDSIRTRSLKRRARILSQLILRGVHFDINFEARVISCAGRSPDRSRSSTKGSFASRGNTDSNSGAGSSSGSGSGSGIGFGPSSGSKRTREGGEDDGPGRNRQPKGKKGKPSSSQDERKLACPFYKRNPTASTLPDACPTSSWAQAFRVKEHLIRKHRVFQCPKCQDVFKTSKGLKDHCQGRMIPCPVRNKRDIFAINQDMAKKLEPRLPYNSEEANWRWMFAELFPNKRIPSPYFGDEDWNKNDAYVDDAAADSGLERRVDLFQTALPARTLESFQRRIELLLESEEDFGHRQLLEATRRGEFKDLLQQSVLEAIGSLQQEATQLQQQDSVSSDQIAVRSKGVLKSSRYNEGAGEEAGSSAELTLESDQLSNPNTKDGEFRLDDWVVDVDFDADAVIRDMNLSHGDFNDENFWTNLEGAYAEFDHSQSPALLDLGAVSSTCPAEGGAESSLYDLNIQANCSGVDANTAYKGSTLDSINFGDPLNDSSKVDTCSNSGLLQNVLGAGHKTLPALSTAEHDGQESIREDHQRVLAASRIVYEPDAGTWASGVTGYLFGGQYQNRVARFQIGQMQATQDLHSTDSNFGPLSEAEADA